MFTAQFTEHILNKLTAHRRLVQVGVSVAVLGDFVRNCYTVSQLAQERFKEIEQEEHAEIVATATTFFKQIATRCQAKDGGDFWPTAISQAAGTLPSSPPIATATKQSPLPIRFNILEELLRPSTTTLITEHSIEHPLNTHPIIEDLSENQDYSQPTATATALAAAITTPSHSPSSSPPVIYITWTDVWSHIFHSLQQTVQFVASTVEERSGESPILCAAREQRQWLAEAALETVDSTREWCRGAMLWPQIEVQRVSALRYRIDWYGVTFPVRDILSSNFSSSKNKSQHHQRLVADLTHTL